MSDSAKDRAEATAVELLHRTDAFRAAIWAWACGR